MSGPDFPDSGAALVIGGSGGIGGAICAKLAARGAHVALSYRNNRDGADAAAQAVRAAGRTAEVGQLALEDPAAVQAFVDDMAARFGGLHSVIYAAGPDIPQPYIYEVTPEDWRRTFDADVNGCFNLVHAALPHLRGQTPSSLTAISTAAVERHSPRDILSNAPKAAVEMLVKGVAREEGRFNIRANCVALGVIDTGLFLRFKEEIYDARTVEAMRKATALKRLGTAEEVAEAVVFLASARAAFVTGQVLAVDGGYQV